jgi:tRNA G18 (ribose-2'-O)-methylase SpoU
MQPIEHPDDPRLDRFRNLIDRGDRPDPDCFFVESETAVARLLASPHFTTLTVLGTAAHLERLAPTCPGYIVDRELLRALLGFDLHRGVIACAARPPQLAPNMSFKTCAIGPVLGIKPITQPVPEASLTQPVPEASLTQPVPEASLAAALSGPRWTVLLVQGLADPANLGSIIRSARAFGVDLVLLDRRGADPLSRRAVRSAMGHVFTQPLALVDDLPAALALIKTSHHDAAIWAATVSPRARPLGSLPRPNRLVLLVGNEGLGLPAALCSSADAEVTIPIAPEVDSLGVAAATAILLHALTSPHARSPGGI